MKSSRSRARNKNDSPSPPPPPISVPSRAGRSTATEARRQAQISKNARIAASLGLGNLSPDPNPVPLFTRPAQSSSGTPRAQSSAAPRSAARTPAPSSTALSGEARQRSRTVATPRTTAARLTFADFDMDSPLPAQLLADMAANPEAANGDLAAQRTLTYREDPDDPAAFRRQQSKKAYSRKSTASSSNARPATTPKRKVPQVESDDDDDDDIVEVDAAGEVLRAPAKKRANNEPGPSSRRLPVTVPNVKPLFSNRDEDKNKAKTAETAKKGQNKSQLKNVTANKKEPSSSTNSASAATPKRPARSLPKVDDEDDEDEDDAGKQPKATVKSSQSNKTSASTKSVASSSGQRSVTASKVEESGDGQKKSSTDSRSVATAKTGEGDDEEETDEDDEEETDEDDDEETDEDDDDEETDEEEDDEVDDEEDEEMDDEEVKKDDEKKDADGEKAVTKKSKKSKKDKKKSKKNKKKKRIAKEKAAAATASQSDSTAPQSNSTAPLSNSTAPQSTPKRKTTKKKAKKEVEKKSKPEKPKSSNATQGPSSSKAKTSSAHNNVKTHARESSTSSSSSESDDDESYPVTCKVNWTFEHPRPWELPNKKPILAQQRDDHIQKMKELGIVETLPGAPIDMMVFDDEVFFSPLATGQNKAGTSSVGPPICTSTPSRNITKIREPLRSQLSVSPIPTTSPESSPEPETQRKQVAPPKPARVNDPKESTDEETPPAPKTEPRYSMRATTKFYQDMLRTSTDEEPEVERPVVYVVVKVPPVNRRPVINRDGRDNIMSGYRLPSPQREVRILLTGHSTESLIRIKAQQEAEAAAEKAREEKAAAKAKENPVQIPDITDAPLRSGLGSGSGSGSGSDAESESEKSESDQPCTSSAPPKPRKIVRRKKVSSVKKTPSSSTPKIRGVSKGDLEVISQADQISTPTRRARPCKAVYTPAPVSDSSAEESEASVDAESEAEIIDPEEQRRKKEEAKRQRKIEQQKRRERRQEEKLLKEARAVLNKEEIELKKTQKESEKEMKKLVHDQKKDREAIAKKLQWRIAKQLAHDRARVNIARKLFNELREKASRQKEENQQRMQLLAAINTPHRHSKRIRKQVEAKVYIRKKPRGRSSSLPPFPSKDLLPASRSKAEPLEALYAVAFNKTLAKMKEDLNEVVNFHRSLDKTMRVEGSPLNFENYKDPFVDVRAKRYAWVRSSCFIGKVTPDQDFKFAPDDVIQDYEKSWYDQEILKERDWANEGHHFPDLQVLKEKFGLKSLSDSGIDRCSDIDAYGRTLYIDGIRSLLDKVVLCMKMFAARTGFKLLRPCHYVQYLWETANYNTDLELIRDSLILLPLHIGDMKSFISVPKARFVGLAMEIFLILLNDWPNTFNPLPEHDFVALCKLEVAALRLGGEHGAVADRLPMMRAAEHIAKWMRNEDVVPVRGVLPQERIVVKRQRLRRHKSFSEFKHLKGPEPPQQDMKAALIRSLIPHPDGFI